MCIFTCVRCKTIILNMNLHTTLRLDHEYELTYDFASLSSEVVVYDRGSPRVFCGHLVFPLIRLPPFEAMSNH